MRQTFIDIVPIRQANGEILYVETSLRGLGVTQAQVVTTGTNITNVVNAANAAIPQGKITVQSDFSKGANIVATGASVVAAATVWFPPAAIIAGIVAAAAALLGKIFANSKAKAYAAERGQYEAANAQIKYEMVEMDSNYDQLYRAIHELKSAVTGLSGVSTSMQGLGLCLWNCKDEKAQLQSTKAEYELLTKQQADKTNLMIELLNQYNELMRELVNIKSEKQTKDWLMYIVLAAVVGGVGYLIVKK